MNHLDVCRIGPVSIAVATRRAALAEVIDMLADDARPGEPRIVAFCNAHTVNLARRDGDLAAALAGALVLNDGVGVDIARRLLHGARFPANLNGTDFTSAVLDAAPGPLRIFLLGSAAGVAERAGKILATRFPRHHIVGTRSGFFDEGDGARIADDIAAAGADLVLVGMGQPRQELWSARHGAKSGAVVMCIGAYLDFTAGVVRRAPPWVRKIRLEWLVRLLQEPRRLAGRYLIGNVRFLFDIVRDRLKSPKERY